MAGKIQNEDLKSSAELVSGGGTAAQLPNDTKIWVTASGILKTLFQAITDGDISGSANAAKQIITLSGTDVTNGYVDLTTEAVTDGVYLYVGRLKMFETTDYTTSVVAGPKTRITFVNTFTTTGENALVAGDVLYVEYLQA